MEERQGFQEEADHKQDIDIVRLGGVQAKFKTDRRIVRKRICSFSLRRQESTLLREIKIRRHFLRRLPEDDAGKLVLADKVRPRALDSLEAEQGAISTISGLKHQRSNNPNSF